MSLHVKVATTPEAESFCLGASILRLGENCYFISLVSILMISVVRRARHGLFLPFDPHEAIALRDDPQHPTGDEKHNQPTPGQCQRFPFDVC